MEFKSRSIYENHGRIDLPVNAINLSNSRGRPIPDNQEVFADANSDQSIIIDLCELLKSASTAEAALKEHAEDIISSENTDVSYELKLIDHRHALEKSIFYEKFKERIAFVICSRVIITDKTKADIKVFEIKMGIIRIPDLELDILISVNSQDNEPGKGWDCDQVFLRAIQSIHFDDFNFM